MSRLESISPLVVAWAVSLGFGGLLLILVVSDETSGPGQVDEHRPAMQKDDEVSDGLPASVPDEKSPEVSDPRNVVASTDSVTSPESEDSGRPTESKSTEPKPVEPKPVEPKPVEPKPVEPKPVEPKPVEPKPVEPKPVEPKPVVAPPRPAREIARALNLPILRYVQKEPVAVSLVLDEVAQLSGVELRLADGLAGDPRLAKTVRLELERTTVGRILDAVLEMIGLSRRVYDGFVEIEPSVKGAERRGS
jgi:hypothetical protein